MRGRKQIYIDKTAQFSKLCKVGAVTLTKSLSIPKKRFNFYLFKAKQLPVIYLNIRKSCVCSVPQGPLLIHLSSLIHSDVFQPSG